MLQFAAVQASCHGCGGAELQDVEQHQEDEDPGVADRLPAHRLHPHLVPQYSQSVVQGQELLQV